MQAYEAGTAAYFATPPVNLIYAFHASLSQITRQAPSLEERFRLHRAASQRMKAAAAELVQATVLDYAHPPMRLRGRVCAVRLVVSVLFVPRVFSR